MMISLSEWEGWDEYEPSPFTLRAIRQRKNAFPTQKPYRNNG